jgi:hypothetical protein
MLPIFFSFRERNYNRKKKEKKVALKDDTFEKSWVLAKSVTR